MHGGLNKLGGGLTKQRKTLTGSLCEGLSMVSGCMPGEAPHTHAHLTDTPEILICVVVAVVFEHISSTREIICRFRFTIEDDLAVSSVQAFRSGLPNYLRLWPTVLRLGETLAKHLLRLKRVPVLIPPWRTLHGGCYRALIRRRIFGDPILRMCVCVCMCVHMCACVCVCM